MNTDKQWATFSLFCIKEYTNIKGSLLLSFLINFKSTQWSSFWRLCRPLNVDFYRRSFSATCRRLFGVTLTTFFDVDLTTFFGATYRRPLHNLYNNNNTFKRCTWSFDMMVVSYTLQHFNVRFGGRLFAARRQTLHFYNTFEARGPI